jgi:hypothetical protein
MKTMHLPVTYAQQPVYTPPKPSTAGHKKISDIKHLNPFSNKVVSSTSQFISLYLDDYEKLLIFPSYPCRTENRMVSHGENNED